MKEILFIDDDARRTQFQVEYFELLGFRVSSRELDSEALDYIADRREAIGLIILDMIMPSEKYGREETSDYFDTGLFLLRDIRKLLPVVPVIILTIRRDLSELQQLSELGVKEILIKDKITASQLRDVIKEIIELPPEREVSRAKGDVDED